jgi:hypothetical protein
MAIIYNSDCTKGLAKNAGISTAKDIVPNQLADKIVPTFETNPEMLRIGNVVKYVEINDATSGTVYTTPTDQDFFITGIQMSYIKDVNATSTIIACRATINGGEVRLGEFRGITLTAANGSFSRDFANPIKLDRGTTIRLTSDTNVAAIRAVLCITGYIVETSNA